MAVLKPERWQQMGVTDREEVSNVVPFEQRPKRVRAFIYCEVKLLDDGGIELTVVDEIGDRVVFGYLLVAGRAS